MSKDEITNFETEHIKYNKIAQKHLETHDLAKRVFMENKQDLLAKMITSMDDIHNYKFKDNCLYRISILEGSDSNVYNGIYALNNFKLVPLFVPTDVFGMEVESNLTTKDLSDLYIKFMDISYPDFRERYLEQKRKEEIKNLDEPFSRSVLKNIIQSSKDTEKSHTK